MTEDEKLKKICDEIGVLYYKYRGDGNYIIQDVREIIFTQEFMDKFREACYEVNDSYKMYDFMSDFLYTELDNPVDYLYNLIF